MKIKMNRARLDVDGAYKATPSTSEPVKREQKRASQCHAVHLVRYHACHMRRDSRGARPGRRRKRRRLRLVWRLWRRRRAEPPPSRVSALTKAQHAITADEEEVGIAR